MYKSVVRFYIAFYIEHRFVDINLFVYQMDESIKKR